MIISASRRTDIPAFYSDWFYNRIRDGYAYVRNPVNPRQISKITLNPEVADCLVFWTKQPEPMRLRLKELEDYSYYFQVTLTGYGRDVEPGLPDKQGVLIPAFQRLSDTIGSGRVIWRYDPVLLSKRYTMDYHLKAFESIAGKLKGYTGRVVISFLDLYPKIKKRLERMQIAALSGREMLSMAQQLSGIAKDCGMEIVSCAEKIDLSAAGVAHGSCIDRVWIEKILGCQIAAPKDKNQRTACGCAESIDLGAYDTCGFGCAYCYAGSFAGGSGFQNKLDYDPESPILYGRIRETDRIMVRKMASQRREQLSFFESPGRRQ